MPTYGFPHPLTQREGEVLCPLPDFSQFNEHITRRPSCGTAMSAFQQVIVEHLPAPWTRSRHVQRLVVEEASDNEQMFRENPPWFPEGARQSKPSLSVCFTEQTDWAELRGDEKQDAAACYAGVELRSLSAVTTNKGYLPLCTSW